MIVWSGKGILVPVIALGFMAAAAGFSSTITGSEAYFIEQMWPLSTTLLLTAAAIWYLGRWFHSGTGRVMIDKETGREVVLQRKHTLFWIKFEYWAVVPAILAVLFMATDLFA